MAWTTEESWFDSWQGGDVFHFSKTSRPALMPTQTPIQWVMEALSNGVNHSTPHPPHPSYSVMACTVRTSVRYDKCDDVDWTQPALDVV